MHLFTHSSMAGFNGWLQWLVSMAGYNGWFQWLVTMAGFNGWLRVLCCFIRCTILCFLMERTRSHGGAVKLIFYHVPLSLISRSSCLFSIHLIIMSDENSSRFHIAN